jgi:uncharacterized integral membrane protein (TIGR00698 family)
MNNKAKGILLCFIIAIVPWLLVKYIAWMKIVGAPILGIVFGMILGTFLKNKSGLAPGIAFTSKKVLQYAVILLGFGLNLTTLARVGLTSLPIIISTIAVSLIVAYTLFKVLKMPAKTSVLIGVGSSICGGSAIAATAPVVQASDEEIAQSISVIFLFNVIAALIFPTLGSMLGFSDMGFALFAGTAINDTSSVTAAASTWDTLNATGGTVLGYATIVKLTRTLAIIPITLALSFYRIRQERKTNSGSHNKVSVRKLFPTFILYFVLASVITTILTSLLTGTALEVVESGFGFLKDLSKFFIVMAMSAIGFNTDIVKLIKKGGKPLFLGFSCWVSIIIVSILMQNVLSIV